MKRFWTRVAILIGGTIAMSQTSMEGSPKPQKSGTPAAQAKTAGGADAVVPIATIESGVAALPPPKRLIVIGNATQFAFLDVCTLGRDKGGVLQIAKAAGVNVPDSLLSLYAGGCAANYLKPEDGWPLIDHVVTAQLRSAFGIDTKAVGLGPDLSAAWAPIDVKVKDA